MSHFVMRLPDVGEGVAEAELVEWLVGVGDIVTSDTVIAEVMTDKATVEVSAPVAGEVVALHGEPGDVLAVGSDFIGIETDQAAPDDHVPEPTPGAPAESSEAELPTGADQPSPDGEPAREEPVVSVAERSPRPDGERGTAAPAVRARAAELGFDLDTIEGSGPDGRVLHEDLDRALHGGGGSPQRSTMLTQASDDGRVVAVRGVRRKIAERLSAAWRDIPHITYVDAVDVTELERLRAELNKSADERGTRLTILPFLARSIVMAIAEQPGLNAHYDSAAETLTTFDAVHLGVATQTDEGLRVPVVRHSEGRDVWGLAAEIGRVSAAARDGSATRDELVGSTITITSLGALGGLVTTPIINPPEVAIVGVNKIETLPVWNGGSFQPRQMMNLSSSFDHRMVDGWDAATFVQGIKRRLETPALLFIADS